MPNDLTQPRCECGAIATHTDPLVPGAKVLEFCKRCHDETKANPEYVPKDVCRWPGCTSARIRQGGCCQTHVDRFASVMNYRPITPKVIRGQLHTGDPQEEIERVALAWEARQAARALKREKEEERKKGILERKVFPKVDTLAYRIVVHLYTYPNATVTHLFRYLKPPHRGMIQTQLKNLEIACLTQRNTGKPARWHLTSAGVERYYQMTGVQTTIDPVAAELAAAKAEIEALKQQLQELQCL